MTSEHQPGARPEGKFQMAEDSPSLKDIDFKGWMDRYMKMMGGAAATGYLAMEGYDRYLAYMQARNARTARQRVRINRNPSSRSGRRDL